MTGCFVTASEAMRRAIDAVLDLSCCAYGRRYIEPARRLTSELRTAPVESKPEVLALLRHAETPGSGAVVRLV